MAALAAVPPQPELSSALAAVPPQPELSSAGSSLAAAAARSPKPPPAAAQPSELCTPTPGFVVKTRDAGGRKVFVNVCGSLRVPAPGNWAGGQARASAETRVKGLLTSPCCQVPLSVKEALAAEAANPAAGAPPEVLRLPLACGAAREAPDAQGALCSVCDCVFNADALAASEGDSALRLLVCKLAIAAAGHKHGWELDEQYKLPKRRYIDEPVRPQRIRLDTAPRIAELPSPPPPVPVPACRPAPKLSSVPPPAGLLDPAKQGAAAGALSQPVLIFEGCPCDTLLAKVPLPCTACTATLLRGCLQVQGAPGMAPISLALPFEVEASSARAWLEQPSSADAPALIILQARLRVLPYTELLALGPGGSKGALDIASAPFLELIV